MTGFVNIGEITKGQVVRYMLTPQILPRLRGLLQLSFGHLALALGTVYRSLGLLPAGHALFLRENREYLTVRNVLAAAAANLEFNWKNADKVVVFGATVTGLVLLVLQFVTLIGYLMINPAFAGNMPTNYGDFFADPGERDVAYMMLFSVFGVPDLFKPGGANSEFHTALHSLFQLYSVGLLVIGALILCYYIFAVVMETAQTGVPFGKRYNHVWVPIRLVFAFGLLIPAGYGLNSAQWITLYSAKLGSDFATKGWMLYNEKLTDSYLEAPEERVGIPKTPDMTTLAVFMSGVLTCKHATDRYNIDNNAKKNTLVKAYLLSDSTATQTGAPPELSASIKRTYKQTEKRTDVYIRFGLHDPVEYTKEKGHVSSTCGDLVIPRGDAVGDGSTHMQNAYLLLVNDIWNGSYEISDKAKEYVDKYFPKNKGENIVIDGSFRYSALKSMTKRVGTNIQTAVQKQASDDSWKSDMKKIQDRGWGGAGIWYNKIAQINGDLITAVNNVPSPRAQPQVLRQQLAGQKRDSTALQSELEQNTGGDKQVEQNNRAMEKVAIPVSAMVRDWQNDNRFSTQSGHSRTTGNAFIDIVNYIFGTQGLYAMCQNTEVHPLAQLSQLGKGLVDASIRNVAVGIGASALSILPNALSTAAFTALSGILMTVASITIVMGFMLYYVLPFLPFLYFFFAVGGWVKGLFEAMVGVPLWALSFLRIDGDGLPGDAGMTGFYLILEIFLRPIMIIFGLLASVVIFAAMVKVLNEIFGLVVANIAGHDPQSSAMCGNMGGGDPESAMDYFRGPIDQFFFTILYAVIVFMIGMSCFKLIDLVPNNILRYMGASVTTFGDKQSDPADGLFFRLSAAGGIVSGKILGGGGVISSLTGAAKGVVQTGVDAANAGKTPP